MSLVDSPNPLKLVVFGANVSGGCNVSTAPERIQVIWEESVRIARASEAAGFDALIPIARWVGFGGTSNHNDRCFETCTWAAGLAALTQTISIFATVHVGSIHPVRMAKEAATIDHISGGRFGVNVVAGYVPTEIEMFGIDKLDHDGRYKAAEEWMEIVRRLWTGDTFDFNGDHYAVRGVRSEPRPIQRPGPMIMNAGNSKQGSAFAAKHADIQYINIFSLDTAAEQVANVRRAAKEQAGRDNVLVMASVTILCRDTEQEVKDYYDYLVRHHGDWEGARNIARALISNSSSILDNEEIIERMVLTMGGWPIIGTPDQVVDQLKVLAATGLDGLALSWPDFDEGIARYGRDLLPRLRAEGLRI
jgi:alkanesulfonate monooxygenase SsuD/methylene tetrahydromethanopterin reductase-like flavin-dependent oxidoreductase (luciferase family)